MPRIKYKTAKMPSWMGGVEGAADIMVGPLGIAKSVAYKMLAKGLPKKVRKPIFKEFKTMGQKSFDLIRSVRKQNLPAPVRAMVSPRGDVAYNIGTAQRSHAGLTSHEAGHRLYDKLKPRTKGALMMEATSMPRKYTKALEHLTKTSLHSTDELFTEGLSQHTKRLAGIENVADIFPPKTEKLVRRIKKYTDY